MAIRVDENLLARLLTDTSSCDIMTCGECDTLALTKHMHIYAGLTGKETAVCPECDLPPMWYSKFSSDPSRNHRRFYVYHDPKNPKDKRVQWGHPTKGNPLEIVGDTGEPLRQKRKREHTPSGLVIMRR